MSEVLSSRLYAACVESSTFLRGQGLEIEMNSVHVSKCVLKSIKTNIISSTTTTTNDTDEKSSSDIATAAATAAVTDLSVADQVKSTDGDSTPATASSSEVDPAAMMAKKMEKIEMEKKKSVASYPPGSVVATVEVMFQSVEEYVHRRQSTVDSTTTTTTAAAAAAAGPVEEVFSKRDKTSTWTFQGCISGQTELHWKIVALDGLG